MSFNIDKIGDIQLLRWMTTINHHDHHHQQPRSCVIAQWRIAVQDLVGHHLQEPRCPISFVWRQDRRRNHPVINGFWVMGDPQHGWFITQNDLLLLLLLLDVLLIISHNYLLLDVLPLV